MGVGKTSVSKVLSNRLNLPYYDTDDLIIQQHGDISQLILSEGELRFRDIEYEVLVNLIQRPSSIISTGGGIVTNQLSRDLLSAAKFVVWLRASFETVQYRINCDLDNDRPLADDRIKVRYDTRQSYYESCASFTVNVDSLTIEEVAEKIINRYG